MRPRLVRRASRYVSPIPPATRRIPMKRQNERALSGRRRNQPGDRVVVERALDLEQPLAELLLQVREQHRALGAREQAVEQEALVLQQRVVELEAGQPPVVVTEPALLRDLLDLDVLAHREVDDRRAHVERSRDLVDERADLAGPELIGRRVLDRCRVVFEHAHGFVGAAHVAEHRVGRAADVAPVAPDSPGQVHHATDQQHGQEDRGTDGRGAHLECPVRPSSASRGWGRRC